MSMELQDCVSILVKYGAAVDLMTSQKTTPLMIASERGHFRLAKALIEELGADIMMQGYRCHTPLYRILKQKVLKSEIASKMVSNPKYFSGLLETAE